jgi:hypothetical protein
MPAATRPYSMAVAPDSSAINALMISYTDVKAKRLTGS